MGTSLNLFKIFDVQVRVHWSFLLILVYGGFMFSGRSDSLVVGALYGVVVTLLLFVCVTLHEFGHALAARHYAIKVPTITLLPIGGVASLEKMPDKPYQELVVALAGPLVNIAIAALLFPIVAFTVGLDLRNGGEFQGVAPMMRTMLEPGVANLLTYMLFTNVLLALFNLLPAFPMDGGRVLRALLAMGMPYVGATRIAVYVGRIMAVLFAIAGIRTGGIFLLLIAFFVYVGGGAELEAVQSRSVLRNIPVARALTPNAVNLYTSERLSRAVDLIITSYQTDYPVLDLGGTLAGVLTRARLISALRQYGPEARIVDVMLPAAEIPTSPSTVMLADVWEKMMQRGSRVIAIVDGGHFVGLITLDDIGEVIHVVGAARERGKPSPADNPQNQSGSPPHAGI